MKTIYIDSSKGGNGDIWMRLIGFYTIAALVNDIKFVIRVPDIFINIAKHVFSDRLQIENNQFNKSSHYLSYTSLGVRHLVPLIIKGKRFISPYAKTVIHDSKNKSVKNFINLILYSVADHSGFIQTPPLSKLNCYQGYQEVVAIKKLRNINYNDFCNQLYTDELIIRNRLLHNNSFSDQLKIPPTLNNFILVFPAGTSRQFIPLWWAQQYLPNAYYAFFYKDGTKKMFNDAGLKTINFFSEPGDIIELAKHAKHIISTDSFPSHLLQYAFNNCTIAITEIAKERVVSPVFRGKIADALAPCHPCLHLDRVNHPLCASGYKECINWKSESYSMDLISD